MESKRSLIWIPLLALWERDIVRFLRQRNRIISALATPIVFWLLLGFGFSSSFHYSTHSSTLETYSSYFFPGSIVLIMLFTGIFSTISVIEDRREGFLQGAVVAPISSFVIPLSKFLGGATLSVFQAGIFCFMAPLVHLKVDYYHLILLIPALILVGLSMTGMGFIFAWPMDSTQGFHALMNIFLMPLWMISGALFPINHDNIVFYWIKVFNPVSYSVTLIRESLSPNCDLKEYTNALLITLLFLIFLFIISSYLVNKKKKF